MICYKDTTFCNFDECKNWTICPRAFTSEKEVAAGNWWKAGGGDPKDAPVCFYCDKPMCFEEKQP